MGFLRSVLGRDWARELERATKLLRDGDPVRALEIASRVRRKAGSELAPRAAELAAAAKRGVRDNALSQAEQAVAGGDLADAADWLEAAIQSEPDARARAALEARVRELEAQLDARDDDARDDAARDDAARAEVGREDGDGRREPTEEETAEPGAALDLAAHYEMLVETVAEPLKARYLDRSPDFQQALVDLNEGRGERALEIFAPLVGSSPDDPVLRLETGRARRFLGDLTGALEDFEVAWTELGDDALDAADSISIVELWAETAIEAGRADEVVARLHEIADLGGDSRVEVCAVYGQALLGSNRLEQAVDYLSRAVAAAPGDKGLEFLFSRALSRGGREDEAIAHLERMVEAGCRTGCGRDQVHLPAFWDLVALYSRRGERLDRARELVIIATNTQGGYLSSANHAVLERFFEASGDHESAERSAREAARLAAIGDGAASRVGGV